MMTVSVVVLAMEIAWATLSKKPVTHKEIQRETQLKRKQEVEDPDDDVEIQIV